VGLSGARRDYPLKPHGKKHDDLRESGVEKQSRSLNFTLEDAGHSKSAYGM
jgi:hypothetical protein